MATVDLGGFIYRFDPNHGRVLDDYVDPQGDFVQHCILCQDDALPGFRAYYRPDYESAREEWVFEWGDGFLAQAPVHLGAYEVQIDDSQGAAHFVSVPQHYWFSRWRWFSRARPARRTAAQLLASGLIPPLDTQGLQVFTANTPPPYAPMALCGLPASQAQTGAYPGLGILTGWQARWLLGEGVSEDYWRTHGEAAGTYQCHVRDTVTHCPIDLVETWPRASTYGDKGDPDIAFLGEPTKVDAGHLPSISYVPFLLTGDPYYLEEMMFHINHCLLMQPPDSRFYVAGRYLAWPMRAFGELVLATKDHNELPNWMLDTTYWEHWLEVCWGFINDRMHNSSDPYYWFFHAVPEWGQATDLDPPQSGDHVWQHSMLSLVAGWLASHFTEWWDCAEWLIHSEVDRGSGTSGWATSHPAPYHLRMRCASVLAQAIDADDDTIHLQYADTFISGEFVTIDSEQLRLDFEINSLTWNVTRGMNGTTAASHAVKKPVYGRKFQSWCEAKASNALVYNWNDTNEPFPPTSIDPTYLTYMRAALAEALTTGLEVPGISDSLAYVNEALVHIGKPMGENWAVKPIVSTRRLRRRPDHLTDQQYHPELAEFRTGDDDPPC